MRIYVNRPTNGAQAEHNRASSKRYEIPGIRDKLSILAYAGCGCFSMMMIMMIRCEREELPLIRKIKRMKTLYKSEYRSSIRPSRLIGSGC